MAGQHTPGPWGIESTTETHWVGPLRKNGKVGEIVCGVEDSRNYTASARARIEANARLIAAAPQLLSSLKTLVTYGRWTIGPESPGHHPTLPSAVSQAEALIAMTEGLD
jgi:hypothetical protein